MPEASNDLSDDNSELVPPDPISNSEVKRLIADGSVGSPHVRVGHRQAFIQKCLGSLSRGIFLPDDSHSAFKQSRYPSNLLLHMFAKQLDPFGRA